MSDIDLTLEEIRNKLDELEHKVDKLKMDPQIIWDINGLRPVESVELKKIKAEAIKPVENFPRPITEDEYENDSRYAKIEIIYYEVDGVFATLNEKLVEYLDEEYFGYDNLNLFDVNNDIYLRDETIHVDYHMFYEGCTSYFAEHKGE